MPLKFSKENYRAEMFEPVSACWTVKEQTAGRGADVNVTVLFCRESALWLAKDPQKGAAAECLDTAFVNKTLSPVFFLPVLSDYSGAVVGPVHSWYKSGPDFPSSRIGSQLGKSEWPINLKAAPPTEYFSNNVGKLHCWGAGRLAVINPALVFHSRVYF